MPTPPNLLNEDGSASLATAMMTSHFALRRDLGRFAMALSEPAMPAVRIHALQEEWQSFHTHLHGHHQAEDSGLFPSLLAQHAELCAVIARLDADHRLIDPVLARGDRAFTELAHGRAEAVGIVQELRTLLDPHLALEEAEIIPLMRALNTFPPPPNDAMAELYAEGFAWSTQGIASDVLQQIYLLLPDVLRSKLPAAATLFQARCDRVWGALPIGAARTPIP